MQGLTLVGFRSSKIEGVDCEASRIEGFRVLGLKVFMDCSGS